VVLIFDMDDTLYPERTYVLSGLRAVADWLAKDFGLEAQACYKQMLQTLDEQGRGKVFDAILEANGILNKGRVKKAVQVYRQHTPNIHLSPEAVAIFARYEHLPKYVVTDGHARVQALKAKVLGLERYVKKVYVTYQYGKVKAGKPSPYCFLDICRREGIEPNQAVHIADNPTKDFVNLKPLGFHTVRIRQGMVANLQLDAAHEAHVTLPNLGALTDEILRLDGSSNLPQTTR
jgi:putative hydrolase of the HAD superfamily